MMAPAAVFLALFVAYPLGKLIVDSFFEFSAGFGATRTFVGIENYADALGSESFQAAALRTVAYTVIVVALEFVLGFAAALMFNAIGRGSQALRTLFLYPLMIAPIVAGILWKFLLIDNFGILGAILKSVGVLSNANDIRWLSDPGIVLFSVALPDIWLTTSFMCLIFYAGLQNLDPEVLEAARIDGASGPSLLLRIVLPLMRPVIAVALVVRMIDAVRAFDIILVMTDGGPQSASQTLSLLVYRTMTRYGEPGLASAMSTLYLIAMLVVAVVAIRFIWTPSKETR